MSDAELAEAELQLIELQALKKEADQLTDRIQRQPTSRHMSIALASAESVGFRLAAQIRASAGRVRAAQQASDDHFP